MPAFSTPSLAENATEREKKCYRTTDSNDVANLLVNVLSWASHQGRLDGVVAVGEHDWEFGRWRRVEADLSRPISTSMYQPNQTKTIHVKYKNQYKIDWIF